jgi:hypothetical protein
MISSSAKRFLSSWLRLRWRQFIYRNWYLISPRWLAVRAVAALLDGFNTKCPGDGCKYRGALDSHHTTYANKGHGLDLRPSSILREAMDCRRMCRRCHMKEHRRR